MRERVRNLEQSLKQAQKYESLDENTASLDRNSKSNWSHDNQDKTMINSKHRSALELRIQQLTGNLLSKQDALESVLAQNHALKVCQLLFF